MPEGRRGLCVFVSQLPSAWAAWSYINADLTSSMGITPIFSPSIGSEKRLKASLISPSSCAETLCSFASLERGAALVVVLWEALPPDLRFGGWTSLGDCN